MRGWGPAVEKSQGWKNHKLLPQATIPQREKKQTAIFILYTLLPCILFSVFMLNAVQYKYSWNIYKSGQTRERRNINSAGSQLRNHWKVFFPFKKKHSQDFLIKRTSAKTSNQQKLLAWKEDLDLIKQSFQTQGCKGGLVREVSLAQRGASSRLLFYCFLIEHA